MCLCRLQRVSGPFVRGAFYWLRPFAPGHFQSDGALLSSHLKDNHIEILFAVLHVNGSLSAATGCFQSVSNPALSWEVSAYWWAATPAPPPPCTAILEVILQDPQLTVLNFELSSIKIYPFLMYLLYRQCVRLAFFQFSGVLGRKLQRAGASSWRSQPSVSSLQSKESVDQ